MSLKRKPHLRGLQGDGIGVEDVVEVRISVEDGVDGGEVSLHGQGPASRGSHDGEDAS